MPDAIDLHAAVVHSSPADVADWPITAEITALQMRPTGVQPDGLAFTSPALDRWPEYLIPGWKEPIQYTVWPVVSINGQWHTAGIIQMWKGRPSTGAPLVTDFAENWVYPSAGHLRWGVLEEHAVTVGERIGFFLTAGDARGPREVTSVRERTNVVAVIAPPHDTGFFLFDVDMPPVDPPVPPVPPDPPVPGVNLATVLAAIGTLQAAVAALAARPAPVYTAKTPFGSVVLHPEGQS